MLELKRIISDAEPSFPMETKAEQTRYKILQASFEEMFENGYQGMRIDAVLSKTGLAKGALYHHFPNKKALGYAVVDEILGVHHKEVFLEWNSTDDPLKSICELLAELSCSATSESIALGCPVNNLVQEMSGLDEGFKQRLTQIFETKIQAISNALKRGQSLGVVKPDIDTYDVAGFIVSSFNGIVGAAKCTADINTFRSLIATLSDYISGLRSTQ